MPISRDEYEKIPYFECPFWASSDGGVTYYHMSETDQKEQSESEDQTTLSEKLRSLFQDQEENNDESK